MVDFPASHVSLQPRFTWICLRCFFTFYLGKSPFCTTIWEIIFLLFPGILSKSRFGLEYYTNFGQFHHFQISCLVKLAQTRVLGFWWLSGREIRKSRNIPFWPDHVHPIFFVNLCHMKQGYSSKMWLGSLFGGSKAPDKQETRADLLGHDGPGLGKDAQHILTRGAPPSAIK